MPGGPYSRTPFGILAPIAWNFAGFSRNSLISCSSSMASSTPATSANVVFGVSLLTSFALDFPKFITRLPPPCTWFITRNSRNTTNAIGSRLTSRLRKKLSLVTFVSNVCPDLDCSNVRIWSETPLGYEAVILVLPLTALFRVMSSVCSLSFTRTLE